MRAVVATVSRGLLLTLLYFAGAAVAILYLRTPADVTLFWPAAGIGYAMVLRFGLSAAWPIAVGQLLLHLWLVPVPALFLPFSASSNAIGTLLACLYVFRRRPRPQLQLRTEDGLLLLRGAVLLCATSAIIGSLGMLLAGMVPPADLPRAYLQWALGDLLGATTMTPSVLLLLRTLQRGYLRAPPTPQALRERLLWCAVMLAVLTAGVAIVRNGSMYPLAAATLPLALLLWSAARYPGTFTAMATMLVSVALALVLGLDGLRRPETVQDTTLVVSALVVISTIPILLSASYREREDAMAALHLRATHDPLTGLLNRDAFEEQARQWLAQADTPLSLLYVDLDNFKLINDSASHAAGDAMLRHAARLVRDAFGDPALVAHSGGDEFTVLVALDADAAAVPGRHLLAAIEAMRVAWQGSNLRTTASIGLAASVPPHVSFDELLSQVDTACHEAKDLGGNRLLVAGQNADSLRNRNQLMRLALNAREVLDQQRFELWCQPIIDLREPGTGQAHFEVLLRWRDSDGQLRPPANLIAAAERFRLGPRLDRHVLDALLDWLDVHPGLVPRIEQCNLNLGAATLVDEEFAEYTAARLARSPLQPRQLCLEITETSVVRDLARTCHFIARMRAMGCRFALDDFGTGFCSFGYLRDLRVDYLKIDGSFVRDLTESRLSESVVRAITDIAHILDMRAVGEHAETDAQLEQLRKLHVDYAQGYVFQKPMPIADFFGVTDH